MHSDFIVAACVEWRLVPFAGAEAAGTAASQRVPAACPLLCLMHRVSINCQAGKEKALRNKNKAHSCALQEEAVGNSLNGPNSKRSREDIGKTL